MDRYELELCLAEAERATSRAQTLKLLDRLERHAGERWIDEPLAVRIRAAFALHGRTPPTGGSAVLRTGETWLLLAGEDDGRVRRLQAGRRSEVSTPFEHEAIRALRGLATTAAKRLRSWPDDEVGFAIEGGAASYALSGSSHGLAACVCALSRAIGRPPRSEVAGTAIVDGAGTLRPVQGLERKAEALRRDWPSVATLVVARQQQVSESLAGLFQIAAVGDLAEALPIFGLSLDPLESAPLEQYKFKARSFEGENQRKHSTDAWLRLSDQARQVAAALAETYPVDSQRALVWGAQFATHAGASGEARELLGLVRDEDVERDPPLAAQRLIFKASNAIEVLPDQAVALAQKARAACEALPERDREELLGQALGTCGRALMHTGLTADAETWLRQGMTHHEQASEPALRFERPRSASYLAICLRRLGRLDEALALTNDALVQVDAMPATNVREMSKLYLLLERGRIHAAAGRDEDAVKDLSSVRAAQPETDAYPALGAERSLVAPLTRLGRHEEARRHLEVCAWIAETAQTPNVARIGAIAVGEELLCATPLLPRERLEPLWRKVFGDRALADVLAMWIY